MRVTWSEPVEGSAKAESSAWAVASCPSVLADFFGQWKRSNARVTKMTIFSDKSGALMTTLVETGIQSKVGSSDESETTVICIEFWPRNSKLFPHLVSAWWASTDSESFIKDCNLIAALLLRFFFLFVLRLTSPPKVIRQRRVTLLGVCRRVNWEHFLTLLEEKRESCNLCVCIEVLTFSQRKVYDHKQNLLL